ncbi:hypothetical protein [Streptomyces shenzhenensis]|uniref:hypothetical protein n=1 Tax=Streptomyces shenzhenensis TaxID=943815 RepID=UPI001C7F7020|nr:hypothetical protein [Streptomyces shenzhenensis]
MCEFLLLAVRADHRVAGIPLLARLFIEVAELGIRAWALLSLTLMICKPLGTACAAASDAHGCLLLYGWWMAVPDSLSCMSIHA